jgi:protein SCO1/2
MTRIGWRALPWILIAVAVGFWASRRLSAPREAPETTAADVPVLTTVPAFRLVAQTGEPFGSEELTGRVWIANFIFTRCPTVCPQLSRRMADVQAAVREDEGIRLVSFSVDPDYDTPEVLREYATRFGADPERWTFLTGTVESIKQAVEEGLKVSSGLDGKPVDVSEVLHGTHFVLVDDRLRIRGYHDVATPEGFDRLVADAERLERSAAPQSSAAPLSPAPAGDATS